MNPYDFDKEDNRMSMSCVHGGECHGCMNCQEDDYDDCDEDYDEDYDDE